MSSWAVTGTATGLSVMWLAFLLMTAKAITPVMLMALKCVVLDGTASIVRDKIKMAPMFVLLQVQKIVRIFGWVRRYRDIAKILPWYYIWTFSKYHHFVLEFLPSVWDGLAACPNRNRTFIIEVTNVDNTTGSFVGQLFIDQAVIPGFGTRYKTSFTFHSQNNVVNYTGTEVTSFNINENMIAYSSMQGVIQLSGIACVLSLKRRTGKYRT